MDDEAEWDALFADTQPQLATEGRRARLEIEQGMAEAVSLAPSIGHFVVDKLRMLPTPDAYWVTAVPLASGRLLAGEYPGAKDPAAATRKLGRYLDAGVTTFIDLTEDDEYHLRPYAAEVISLAVARGMTAAHHRHPIPDLGAPTPPQMTATLDAIDAALAAGQTVYVHCYGGVGRTGTVVGCWLVRHGLSGAAALAHIAAQRAATPDGHRVSPETPDQWAMVLTWREADHP